MAGKPKSQIYFEMHSKGMTKRAIAKKFSVSPSTVADGIKRYLDPGYCPAARFVRAERRTPTEKSRFVEAFELVRDGMPIVKVAEKLGLNRNTVRRAFRYYTDPTYQSAKLKETRSTQRRNYKPRTVLKTKMENRLDTDAALSLFNSGVHVAEIATRLNVRYSLVYNRLRKATGQKHLRIKLGVATPFGETPKFDSRGLPRIRVKARSRDGAPA
jgi:transposase